MKTLLQEVNGVYLKFKAAKYDLKYTAPECLPTVEASDTAKAIIQCVEERFDKIEKQVGALLEKVMEMENKRYFQANPGLTQLIEDHKLVDKALKNG